MKYLILVLLLSGCAVKLEDHRIDPAQLEQALFNHQVNLNAINGYIKELQDTKVLPTPKRKEDKK